VTQATRGLVGRRPPYLYMDEVADLLNRATKSNAWTSGSVRKLLSAQGAATPLPGDPAGTHRRHMWVTTRAQIREVLPVLYAAILRSLSASGETESDSDEEGVASAGERSGVIG